MEFNITIKDNEEKNSVAFDTCEESKKLIKRLSAKKNAGKELNMDEFSHAEQAFMCALNALLGWGELIEATLDDE